MSSKKFEKKGPEGLVTGQQVSSLLQISEATLRKLARAGEIPSVTVGRRRRYDLAAVMASVAGQGAGEVQS